MVEQIITLFLQQQDIHIILVHVILILDAVVVPHLILILRYSVQINHAALLHIMTMVEIVSVANLILTAGLAVQLGLIICKLLALQIIHTGPIIFNINIPVLL